MPDSYIASPRGRRTPLIVIVALCAGPAVVSRQQTEGTHDASPAASEAPPSQAAQQASGEGKEPRNENLIANGGFEAPADASPWYYVRWGTVVERSDVPEGRRCMQFESRMPGQEAQAQQTIRLDGTRLFAVR